MNKTKQELPTKQYLFYRDPGHGWLAVTRQELIDLHIDKQISKYSYQQHNQIYLEEDSDMPLFLNAKRQANAEIIETIRRYPEQDSIIRTYEPYSPNYVAPKEKPFTVQTAEKTSEDIRRLRKSNYGRQPIPEIVKNLTAIAESKCINQPAPREASLWNAIDFLETFEDLSDWINKELSYRDLPTEPEVYKTALHTIKQKFLQELIK